MWKCINVESSLLWADGSEEEVHKNCTVANPALGWGHLKKGGGGGVLKLQIDQHLSSIHLVLNKMNITSSSWQERGILIVQDTIWKVDWGKKLWLISWVQSKAWRHSWVFFCFFVFLHTDWTRLVSNLFIFSADLLFSSWLEWQRKKLQTLVCIVRSWTGYGPGLLGYFKKIKTIK